MNDIKGFTFYKSYYESLKNLKEKDKKDESYQTQFELYKYYKKLDDSKPQNTEKQFEVRRK